jgi:DNA-binding NtrC family response regulator
MDMVIQAMQEGAVDFIRKPFDLIDILLAIKRTKKYLDLQNRLNVVQNKNSLISIELADSTENNFIGASKDIKEVIDLALKVSKDRDINVMITGENGTGKEIIARIIHHASERNNKPFFPVNSAAIPETLLESEFFGHRKGAFTDAKENRKGYFDLANGGSLFLYEIGDMPFSLQAKLLRAIEEKKIKQVGSDKEYTVDVRIISATNQNITKLIEDKIFRLDLYHRINSFIIHITPLRERPDDIEPLMLHFAKMFAKKRNRIVPKINRNVIRELKKYHFPGNIRELKNMTERALVLCTSDTLDLSNFTLSLEKKKSKQYNSMNLNLEENEILFIRAALSKTNYNQNRASKYLGISRDSLIRRMKKYNIQIKKDLPDKITS